MIFERRVTGSRRCLIVCVLFKQKNKKKTGDDQQELYNTLVTLVYGRETSAEKSSLTTTTRVSGLLCSHSRTRAVVDKKHVCMAVTHHKFNGVAFFFFFTRSA